MTESLKNALIIEIPAQNRKSMKHTITQAQTRFGTVLVLLGVFTATTTAMAQTWQTVLAYQRVAGKSAAGLCLAADASGNVFSGGEAEDSSSNEHGLVLKTDTTQGSWFLGDDTNPNPSNYISEVYNLGFDSIGNLYSVGQLWPGHGLLPPYWQVRKSSDRGATWTTVDLYQYPSGSWIDVTGFTADNSGNIYVVGGAMDAAGNRHWLARKSANGGQTWALVDD